MAMPIYNETPVKCGTLNFRHKNHIMKKYRKHYVSLFPKSESGVPRLEVYENEKDYRANSYCLLIPGSEVVSVRSCYRPQSSDEKFGFIIATKEQQHYFSAVDRDDLDEWIKKTTSTLLQPYLKSLQFHKDGAQEVMQDNELYESADEYVREFRVMSGAETRQLLGVEGEVRLVIENGSVTLITLQGNRAARWGIEHLRRSGYKNKCFYLEAGRKSEHGEGFYSFVTNQGKQICASISKEKKYCREQKEAEAAGLKPKMQAGLITSAKADDDNTPMTTGGHIYEDPDSLKINNNNKIGKVAPDKPLRLNRTRNGSSSDTKDFPAGGGEGRATSSVSLNTLPKIKSQPTHGSSTFGPEVTKYQPAKDVLPILASSSTPPAPTAPNNSFTYSEVYTHTHAWKRYGRDEPEEDPTYDNVSVPKGGEYDRLNYNQKNVRSMQLPVESLYSCPQRKPLTPGQLYDERQQRQQQLQQKQQHGQQNSPAAAKPVEAIYSVIDKSQKRKQIKDAP